MIFDFLKPPKKEETHSPLNDYSLFQQIGSAFQTMAMRVEQEISVASQSNFMDKIRQKRMIVGLEMAPPPIESATPAAGEQERLAEQLVQMKTLLKNFQASIEHNANHVSCRMHDFRSYLLTDSQGHGINKEAIFVRASDCVNSTLGDLIVLKEDFKKNISLLTLQEEDASRLFQLLQALEQTYSDLTTDMQAKLRLLNATLCH